VAIERHQTLRATIDWSYELLSTWEQHLLARLSVFAAGCTLEATSPSRDLITTSPAPTERRTGSGPVAAATRDQGAAPKRQAISTANRVQTISILLPEHNPGATFDPRHAEWAIRWLIQAPPYGAIPDGFAIRACVGK
jgi:hypothetical protein